MLKILAIGNSFSQDSTTYLYDLAKSGGVELKVVNLYIGGCSLETHWNNIVENKKDYEYQLMVYLPENMLLYLKLYWKKNGM